MLIDVMFARVVEFVQVAHIETWPVKHPREPLLLRVRGNPHPRIEEELVERHHVHLILLLHREQLPQPPRGHLHAPGPLREEKQLLPLQETVANQPCGPQRQHKALAAPRRPRHQHRPPRLGIQRLLLPLAQLLNHGILPLPLL